jgi:hypothetical protein
MTELSSAREKLLDVTEAMVRFRFHLVGVLSGLRNPDLAGEETDAETELRSDLECALVDNFDPLLRTLLAAAGGARAKVLEGALDLAGLKLRLQALSDSLPRSPREDAMLEGEIPADVPTEMRTTINAVVEDQLDFALDNLLHAAGYKAPAE